ncbi:hypothetical protein [Chryseolinea serpens]|uniref:hypothetical protein n=1 Tax=Chryseolinea serpens TaxID=947013 RepID=UPI0011612DA4|nr:hypothetical protein [Chryseolinea serpens]
MKRFKIAIGFFLLLGAGGEYIEGSTQVGSWINPGIITGVVLVLLLSTWLIGSGFSKDRFAFKSLILLRYFAISFGVFVLVAVFNLLAKASPGQYVDINGLRIPIKRCVDGNRRIIPDEKSREAYCVCAFEKITNNPELKEKYKARLEDNKATEVLQELESQFGTLGIRDCLLSSGINWTAPIADAMIRNWKKELTGTEFEQTNDVNKYCDCLIGEYQKFPLREVAAEGFGESAASIRVVQACAEASRK